MDHPHGHHVEPIPVDQLGARRRELLSLTKHATGSQMVFYPRLLSLKEADPKALEALRCDLLSLGQPYGLSAS